MQRYKNPKDFLASIVVKNDNKRIRKEVIDKVDGGIILQEVIYCFGYLLSPGSDLIVMPVREKILSIARRKFQSCFNYIFKY